jgi:hypothetical protein
MQFQSERENELSLSEWFPWQNRLQPYFMVDHSNQTKNFVEMVEFLELQGNLLILFLKRNVDITNS